ncbi:DUF3592 domain-containing protein [Amycolatopsis bullii]|uniref:DUF3592 domain-containing protein n=1 Tax=Amycolatopsis bullii TaxID=941987 RepID=A0ABQ3KDE4_9PSEU|nr:DUF3592 domain-containing protein [Amycolatopsis bullii]
MVAVAVYRLSVADPVFDRGDVIGLIVVFAVSLACLGLGGRCLRKTAHRIRATASENGFGSWLPAATADDHDRRVDFGAETGRLRRITGRAAALILVWIVLFASGLTGMSLLDAAADELLATGRRVPGVVVSVDTPAKGTPSMQVRFGGRTVKIVRDSGHRYQVGEAVTVVVDPADPARVRTTEEENENQFVFFLCLFAVLLGLAGAPVAAGAALGWRRRARAVAATGWRVATVDVVPDRSVTRRKRLPPTLHVRYRDGTGIVLRAVPSTHGANALADFTDRLAWVGGWGREMVVLFPQGPRRPGPYAVPAAAKTPRAASGFRRSRR